MSYTFPRVNTTIVAKTRTASVYIENPKVPVLFATIVSDKGPFSVTKVRSLTEFKEIYGELSYLKQGQDVLNLYQWIGSIPYNGYAWIKRIDPAFIVSTGTAPDVVKTYVEDTSSLAKAIGPVNSNGNTFTFNFTAKNPGILFTKYTVTVSQRKNSLGKFMPEFNITIRDEKSFVVDNLKGVTKTNYSTMLPLLQYFDVTLVNPSLMPSAVADTSVFTGSVGSVNATLALGEGLISGLTTTVTPSNIFEAISLYYRVNARLELEDDLSYPIYMILDGNYPDSLKKDIIDFIRDARNDVHFMLSRAKYKETIPGTVDITLELDEMNESDVNFLLAYDLPEKGNVTIWAPDIARVKDPEVNGYINVSSIYELAYKIPYNDYNYGIWWNFVGPRRGITLGELLHTNTSKEKQDYTDTLTNYIEKTNRDQCFMLQRTTGTPNTAYVQLHASRLTQYIRREVKWIGRRYMYEYNDIDATTYAECKNEIRAFLNKFASIAIDMSKPYILDIFKTGETTFQVNLTNLKYKDIAETVDLYIELD
jgi:hypothetical protein